MGNEPPAQTEPAPFRITATDFDFALPSSVSAASYDFTLINRGEQFHHAQFYKMAEGVSFEEFREVLISNPKSRGLPGDAIDLVDGPPTGLLGEASPDESVKGRGELQRGVYAVVCFLRDLELGTGRGSGKAHHALGMTAEVQVT